MGGRGLLPAAAGVVTRGGVVLATSLWAAGALAAPKLPPLPPTSYGPSNPGASLAAPDNVTPPASLTDQPSRSHVVEPGVTSPNPAITSGATPTLQDALAEVYLTNPTLLTSRARLRATDENVPAALSGWRPTVTVTASSGVGFGYYQNGSNGTSTTSLQDTKTDNNRYILQEGVSITQPLYRGGRTTSATAQAESQVRGERARLIAAEEQAFSDGVSAYVTVIQNQQLYELQVNNVQVLAKTVQATNARFSVGEITRTDVAQAQAALANAIGQRETALGNLQTARSTYRRVIGELPGKLVEPQPLHLPMKTVDEVNTLASNNNATVVASMYDVAAAQDAVDVSYAAVMPQLSVQALGQYTDQSSIPNQRQLGGTFLGNLTVPLYQGGSEYAAIRQAKQNEQVQRKTLDDTRRQAVQQATQYWEQYLAAKAVVASARAQITADEVALDGVEREALAGTQTTLDVLNAEQLLLGARVTLVQSLATLVNNSYLVAAAVGRLTARDLALKVPLYDETAYYRSVRGAAFGTNDRATAQPGR